MISFAFGAVLTERGRINQQLALNDLYVAELAKAIAQEITQEEEETDETKINNEAPATTNCSNSQLAPLIVPAALYGIWESVAVVTTPSSHYVQITRRFELSPSLIVTYSQTRPMPLLDGSGFVTANVHTGSISLD